MQILSISYMTAQKFASCNSLVVKTGRIYKSISCKGFKALSGIFTQIKQYKIEVLFQRIALYASVLQPIQASNMIMSLPSKQSDAKVSLTATRGRFGGCVT